MSTRQQHKEAQQRASAILQVRSGQITATEAARVLGISRKSYYQWEKRGLDALLAAVEQQASGRPPQRRSREVQALERRIAQLETKLKTVEQTARLRALILGTQSAAEPMGKKNKAAKAALKKKRSL